jgi:hypothetical protein
VKNSLFWYALGPVLALVWQPQLASADLGACNDVSLRAEATCEVVPPSVQCQERCTPVTIRATCSARLAASCDASCSKVPSIMCQGSCQAGCEGKCKVDPGKFDCRAACEGDCSGSCEAGCKSKSDSTQCMAECQGSCSVTCKKSCEVKPPSADCQGYCQASCDGSCRVETNLDCQVDCQAKAYASCQAEVMGGCDVACKGKDGALFCDGQFVDYGDNLQMCVDALRARLAVHVQASSSGSASCDGGQCTATGTAKVKSSCSVAAPGASNRHWAAPSAALFGLLGLGTWRRRRRRGQRA